MDRAAEFLATLTDRLNQRPANREASPVQTLDPTPTRPAGFQPGEPSPDLLTEEEAIRYLRLHEIAIKNPEETLRRYRREGHLRGTQVSKRVFYLKHELDAFLNKMTDHNPR
jgi:hypothetical protein